MNKFSAQEKAGLKELHQRQSRDRGCFLYNLRIRDNLTLGEAAAKIGINKSTLCRYEQGIIIRMQEDIEDGICRTYRITQDELRAGSLKNENGSRSAEEPGGHGDPEETGYKNAGIEKLLLPEEEFIRIYRNLDDRTKLRVQFLAGAVGR